MLNTQNPSHRGDILIVDDTPENLQVLSTTLSDIGYKVRGVINGKMALRAASSAQPDLILLDIRMPDMNGYQVCEQLKINPQTREIPVIFISASDQVGEKVKAFQVGGVDYITKPFQVEEVIARVNHQLTIRRLQQQIITKNQQLEQEIIERKKAQEAAAAASLTKTQFVANISHELRTPLNAILGFTQVLLQENTLTKNHREYLDIIHRSGNNLLELINDILDISKIEVGMITLDEQIIDLYQFLHNLEEIFQFQAQKKHLALNFIIESDVPQSINTDEKKLRICLTNLLTNAIKFTAQGSITLRVQPQDSQLIFEIQDTGVGIPSAELEQIFEAFVQTESGKKAQEGTGLGLSITRKFVELMGGNINVTSQLGVGSTFKFSLPLKPVVSAHNISVQQGPLIPSDCPIPAYKILLVDDNQESMNLLFKLLEPLGFKIQQAANGVEAIQQWKKQKPHLIFMNTRMPVMGGIETTKQIRSQQKYSRASPIIIAVTPSPNQESRAQIMAAGFDDLIETPWNELLILSKISHYLGVNYIYEDCTSHPPPFLKKSQHFPQQIDSFLLTLLAQMPQDWIQELNQAVNEINEELIAELILKVPQTLQPLVETLQELLQDFRLDIIERVTRLSLDSQ